MAFMNNNVEKLIFKMIFCSFVILSILYLVLLGNMVKNIVARQALEVNSRILSNEVQELETTYLSLSNNIDLPLSYSMGFKEVKPIFVTRQFLGVESGGIMAKNDL